jgi:predicted amidophosphoribosyltransferase
MKTCYRCGKKYKTKEVYCPQCIKELSNVTIKKTSNKKIPKFSIWSLLFPHF